MRGVVEGVVATLGGGAACPAKEDASEDWVELGIYHQGPLIMISNRSIDGFNSIQDKLTRGRVEERNTYNPGSRRQKLFRIDLPLGNAGSERSR